MTARRAIESSGPESQIIIVFPYLFPKIRSMNWAIQYRSAEPNSACLYEHAPSEFSFCRSQYFIHESRHWVEPVPAELGCGDLIMPTQSIMAEVVSFPRVPADIELGAPNAGIFGSELELDEDTVTDAKRPNRLIDAPNEALTADQIFRNELVVLIPSLRSFALRLCGHHDMADDLSQDAMMRGWAARSRYQSGTNLRAWIFTILRNQMYSDFRKARQTTALDDHEVAELLLVQAPAQQHAIHLADVEKALLKLPWNQRQVLELVGAGGKSYEEAVLIVGCPMGTLKGRIWRGRKALAAMIDGPADAILFDILVPQVEASEKMPRQRNLQ